MLHYLMLTSTQRNSDVPAFFLSNATLIDSQLPRIHAEDIAQAVLHYLMLAPEAKLTEPFIKFVILGLGFLFLGKQEAVEPTVEVVRSLNERVSQFAAVTLEACAYAGTGNVLKVQSMLAMCGEHIDVEEGQEWKVRVGATLCSTALVTACGASACPCFFFFFPQAQGS